MTVTLISAPHLSKQDLKCAVTMNIDQMQGRQIEEEYEFADFAIGYEDEIRRQHTTWMQMHTQADQLAWFRILLCAQIHKGN